jgi:tetratricopeptide (TPR) repeat protein
LKQVAERFPLLLLLDDLQWMDPETGRLLFHIFRSLQNTRILIVGAYRQEEVALGRDGEPHPLELLVNEFQSSRGQIRIDLDENRARTGRQFVDAYLNTELNQLDSSFRQEFYDHTQGHPLFTVQMLRNLQEREEIFRDEKGRWITSARLSWDNLPPQIEGVIGERIGRLDRDLQEVLTVASVEGEQFTLQVLEGVLKKDVSKVLPCLSRDLEKRHRLVQEIGEVTAGGQRLVRFHFAHTLVQQYVYQQLGMTERARLHQQIAECLEGLYKEDIPSIAAVLANHYQAAGIKAKAVDYLLLTGDQARSLYAHQEAIRCYQLAIKYLKEIGAEDQEAHTLMKLYLVYHNSFDYSRAQQTLKEYEALTRRISDHRRIQNSSAKVYSYRLGVIKKPLLDPAFSDSLFDLELLREIFCGLVELSGDRNLIPWVSRHWDVLDGGCRYIFHLRDDFLWNDGVVVTADDFEFAWKRVLDPATHALSANLLFNIAGARDFHLGYSDSVGISAPNRFTLEVRLEEPCGYFPYILGDPIAFAVPKHVIEKKGDAWISPEWYVTNGAFQLDPHNRPAISRPALSAIRIIWVHTAGISATLRFFLSKMKWRCIRRSLAVNWIWSNS